MDVSKMYQDLWRQAQILCQYKDKARLTYGSTGAEDIHFKACFDRLAKLVNDLTDKGEKE